MCSFISKNTVQNCMNIVLYHCLLLLTTTNNACTVQTANGFSVNIEVIFVHVI